MLRIRSYTEYRNGDLCWRPAPIERYDCLDMQAFQLLGGRPPLVPLRGLPEDLSPQLRSLASRRDRRSGLGTSRHSYIFAAELQQAGLGPEFAPTLQLYVQHVLGPVADRYGGENVRFVYGFGQTR